MKEIFEQYGGALITVTAILAVIAVIILVIGSGDSGTVYKAFTSLINEFLTKAKSNANITAHIVPLITKLG